MKTDDRLLTNNSQRQAGIGVVSLISILAVLGFAAMVVLKLAPVYLENFQVKSILDSLNQERQVTRMGRTEVRKKVMRRFDVNDVKNVPPKAIEIKAQPNFLRVRIAYEVRVPMIGNLDVVAKFDDIFEAGGR
jgi:hypothetical protein